jgi:hypothetical protein
MGPAASNSMGTVTFYPPAGLRFDVKTQAPYRFTNITDIQPAGHGPHEACQPVLTNFLAVLDVIGRIKDE